MAFTMRGADAASAPGLSQLAMEMFLLSGPALDIPADQSRGVKPAVVFGLETPWYFAWKVARLTLTC